MKRVFARTPRLYNGQGEKTRKKNWSVRCLVMCGL